MVVAQTVDAQQRSFEYLALRRAFVAVPDTPSSSRWRVICQVDLESLTYGAQFVDWSGPSMRFTPVLRLVLRCLDKLAFSRGIREAGAAS